MTFGILALMEALDLSNGTLQIKFGRDEFRIVRGYNQMNLYFTLFNLGKLIHSSKYIFTLAFLKPKNQWKYCKIIWELFCKILYISKELE
jgi:hypothetical protein